MVENACGSDNTVPVPLAVLSSRWLLPAVTGAGLLVTWAASTRAAAGSSLLVMAVLGALLLAFVASRLTAAAIGLLVLGGTLLPDRWGALSVAGVRTDAVEVFAFLVILAFCAQAVLGRVRRPRILWPFLLFQVAVVLGLFVGAAHGTGRDGLQGGFKTFVLYLLPVVFAGLFASEQAQDSLDRALIRICDIGSVVAVAAAVLHLPLAGGTVTTQVETLGETVNASRIRTPLLALLTVAILLVLGRVLDRGATRGDALRLLGYPLPVLLSFNRSTWVPLLGACVLLGLLRRGGPGERGRGLRVGLVALLVGGLAFGVATSGALGETPRAAAQRAASAVNPSVTRELSYTDRQREDAVARKAIAASPLVGVGIGRPYGARRAIYYTNPPRLVYFDRLYIHNSYLGVWLQLGLLGLLALAVIGIATVRETVAALRELPAAVSTRHLAAGLSVLVAASAAVFQTSLGNRASILGLSCAFALLQRPRLS
jgi:hypothetical protein